MSYFKNLWNAFLGSVQVGVTPNITRGNAPQGTELVALAIKTTATGAVYESTREAIDLAKGTITACLNAVASERAVLKFVVKQFNGDTMLSKQISKVLNHPNAVQSRTDFMEMCSQFHDATGQAIVYFVNNTDRIDGGGYMPVEMWCLPAFFLVPLFDTPQNPIPNGYQWADGRAIVDTHLTCIIRNNSFKVAPYTGRGILADQIDNLILYDLVNKSQVNYFINGGAPNIAAVAPEGVNPTKEQIELIQGMWKEKYNPSTGLTNIAVFPDGLKPHSFGPQEMNYNLSKEEIRDSIREAMQTPKIILGDTDNVNHNNGQTALAMFERLKVLRWGEKFAASLEHFFYLNYSKGITVTVDETVKASFTQLPQANGVITMPDVTEFSDPKDPNG